MTKQECKCGHHKDTHHESKGVCLGVLCNCTVYLDSSKPDPVVTRVSVPKANLNKPHADYSCGCGACLAWKKRVGW